MSPAEDSTQRSAEARPPGVAEVPAWPDRPPTISPAPVESLITNRGDGADVGRSRERARQRRLLWLALILV
ncbi:MAG: hypothetical protein ACRDYB_10390, partial [Acidimicrobiales bacterium]